MGKTAERPAHPGLPRSSAELAPGTLDTTFAAAPVGMAVGDENGAILLANASFATLLGSSPSELVGKSIFAITHPDDAPVSRDAFDRIRRREIASYTLEKRYLRTDGETVWARIYVSTLQNDPGLYLLHIVDITTEKESGQRLHDSETRFREMAESIDQDFWILSFEPFELLYSSPAAARIWGFDPMSNRDAPHRIVAHIHPEDLAIFTLLFDPTRFAPREREYRIMRSDGEVRWVRTRVFPVMDATGNPYRLTGVTEDITSRKEAELEVERHREFERFIMRLCTEFVNLPAEQVQSAFERALGELALLIDADRAGIFVIDNKTNVLCVKCSWRRDEVAAETSFTEFSFPPDNPLRARLLKEGLLRVDDVEKLPDQLGEIRRSLIANRIGSFIDLPLVRRGKLIGLYGFGTVGRKVVWSPDVAARLAIAAEVFSNAIERAQMEAEVRSHRDALAHALRVGTMGQLASGIAHELNQPLAAILNYASAFERRTTAGSTDLGWAQDAVRKIAEQAMRAADVIRTLRALVRKSEGERTWRDPHELVQTAIRFVEPELITPGIAIVVEQSADLPRVQVDPIQIEQVVMNLVRNAIDAVRATPSGSRRAIRVTTRARSPDTVEIRVSDNGLGIAPDEADRLFDEFFTTKAQGLGLGLSISRSIVESHGGNLWLESTSPAGTTFCFTLPAAQE